MASMGVIRTPKQQSLSGLAKLRFWRVIIRSMGEDGWHRVHMPSFNMSEGSFASFFLGPKILWKNISPCDGVSCLIKLQNMSTFDLYKFGVC